MKGRRARFGRWIAAAAAVALVGAAFLGTSEAKPREPGRSPLAGLAWLVGTWRGEEAGAVSEERWSEALAETMVGTFREVTDGKLQLYEFMVLEAEDEHVVLRLRHFNPGLVPWPSERDGPLTMRMTERGEKKAVFEDPARGFPRTITYSVADDVLTVHLEGRSGDKPMSMDVRMKRVP